MTKRLARVAPLQCGIVLAVTYALLSLVFVPILLIFATIAASLPQQANVHPLPTGMLGGSMVAMAVVMPILYGVFGFIGGVIAAFVYNLVAGWTGGLEVTFVDVPPGIPSQASLPTNY